MLAREKHGCVALLHLINADCALDLVIRPQHLLADWFAFQVSKCFFCSWGSSVGLRISLHQASDDTVQGLLGVDSIACHGVGRVEKAQDVMETAGKSRRRTSPWSLLTFLTLLLAIVIGWA